jgi:hypothetical protein
MPPQEDQQNPTFGSQPGAPEPTAPTDPGMGGMPPDSQLPPVPQPGDDSSTPESDNLQPPMQPSPEPQQPQTPADQQLPPVPQSDVSSGLPTESDSGEVGGGDTPNSNPVQ